MKYSLNGNWQLNEEDRQENYPISIPGDIYSSLIQNNIKPDPYWADNEFLFNEEGRKNWVISRKFNLPEKKTDSRYFLRTETFDTIGEIRLNGELIHQHENMFVPLLCDISDYLKQGNNVMEIKFLSPEKEAEKKASLLEYSIPSTVWENSTPHRNMIRKVQCHGEWDWGPRMMTSGIYEDIYIEEETRFIIRYLNAVPGQKENYWCLKIEGELDSFISEEITARFSINNKSESKLINLAEGKNTFTFEIDCGTPALWWPAGMGNQTLYPLKIQIEEKTEIIKTGFRVIEHISINDDNGKSMYFKVNGKAVFCKGANWIPVDALPSRQTEKKYRDLLEDSVAAHMNMIRLWGGGQYEKDIFYDLCDELGLLIWHDMMFACSLYPATDDFGTLVEEEIIHQIKRLKSHPSIALWCGNNEDLGAMGWYEESKKNPARYLVDYDRLNEGIIGKNVRQYDPSRAWWPSSPSAGPGDYSDCWHDDTKGDMHYWSVWHENKPFESFYDITPRFCSEFGFQSFPSLETVRTYAPEDQWNVTSPIMRHHQKNNRGNHIIISTLGDYFLFPEDFPHFLYLSQVQQALAIRTAVEYWRSMRPVSMGALYWQLNDNWPVASWSSIDYTGRWKILHYEAARFFAPRHISLFIKENQLSVYGINDGFSEIKGKLSILFYSYEGKLIETISRDETIPAEGVASFYSRELKDKSFKKNHFCMALWESESGETIRNYQLLCRPRDAALTPANIIAQKDKTGQWTLSSDKPAFYLTLESSEQGRFDDNGFLLMPKDKKTIRFIDRNKQIREPGEISVHCLNRSSSIRFQ